MWVITVAHQSEVANLITECSYIFAMIKHSCVQEFPNKRIQRDRDMYW